MINPKRHLLSWILGFVCLFTAACGGGTTDVKIDYKEYTESTLEFTDNGDPNTTTYNKDLYYRNDLTLDIADPFIVYDNGYYYAYGTSSLSSFPCYRSENLSDWTKLADSFTPPSDSWGRAHLWAPDILKIGDKWYLYYTGTTSAANGSMPRLGVAVADKPEGPYRQYTGKNALGQTITNSTPPFTGGILEGIPILDSTVFEDDDGSLYMYFSVDARRFSGENVKYNTDNADIWGVKLLDPVTWDLSTLTRLLRPGYQKEDDIIRKIGWETWSPSFGGEFEGLEGPYMLKSNGKYYLTYCANSFIDVEYAVGYAVSDSPLGVYNKPKEKYLDNMLLGVPGASGTYINTRYLGFMTGTGHSAIFKAGDEYMFVYHAHKNRDKWGVGPNGNTRSLAVDYIRFDENGVPYTNGPTYSLVRQPKVSTGYENLARKSTILANGENAQYLNDEYTNRAEGTEEVAKEANFEAGLRHIEIKFDKPVYVKAVNVYNSYDYARSIDEIKQIDFGEGNAIVNALFNQRYFNKKQEFIYPHTAFNIELKDLVLTDRIVVTVQADRAFSLGEIEVIGKEAS